MNWLAVDWVDKGPQHAILLEHALYYWGQSLNGSGPSVVHVLSLNEVLDVVLGVEVVLVVIAASDGDSGVVVISIVEILPILLLLRRPTKKGFRFFVNKRIGWIGMVAIVLVTWW